MGSTMIEQNHLARPGQFFDQVDTLWIILLLDLSIIRECRVLRRTPVELKTRCIQRDRILFPSKILDLHLFGILDPVPLAQPGLHVYVYISEGSSPIFRWYEVLELSSRASRHE